MSLVFCDSLTLLPAGFRGAGNGYEALPRGPEVGGPVLPERQPGQDGALPGALGANWRPGGSQNQTKTGRLTRGGRYGLRILSQYLMVLL